MNRWAVVYEGAYKDDGTLFFPEKLSKEFLENTRKTMGVYIFTNQYLNQVIPDEDQDFKKSWLNAFHEIPPNVYTFAFIDPAISLNDGADYTATVVVHVDADKNWYVDLAYRQRITAPDTVRWIFKVHETFNPLVIGIEDVAYQKSLLHFLSEEMTRSNKIIPIKGVRRANVTTSGDKRSNNSKPLRIRALVPRFEFKKIYLKPGLDDLILELTTFPRGSHDDLLDALASIEEIVVYPEKQKEIEDVRDPQDPRYERQFIRKLLAQAARGPSEEEY